MKLRTIKRKIKVAERRYVRLLTRGWITDAQVQADCLVTLRREYRAVLRAEHHGFLVGDTVRILTDEYGSLGARKGTLGTVVSYHGNWGDDESVCPLAVAIPTYHDSLPYKRWEVELVNP